jgi:hypothetical protein
MRDGGLDAIARRADGRCTGLTLTLTSHDSSFLRAVIVIVDGNVIVAVHVNGNDTVEVIESR